MFVLIEYVQKPCLYACAGVSSGTIGLTFVPSFIYIHTMCMQAVKGFVQSGHFKSVTCVFVAPQWDKYLILMC